MAIGKVKFFNESKGFGFITPEDGSNDVFVHVTALEEGVILNEGDSVEYTIGEGKKGPQAEDVVVLQD